MRLKRMRLAALLVLPLALFVPLNYLVRSRQPVTVNIGSIADNDQEKTSLHALARLIVGHPRASRVIATWHVHGQARDRKGIASFDRQENAISFFPVTTKSYPHGRRCDDIHEFDALNWARQGKMPGGYCMGDPG